MSSQDLAEYIAGLLSRGYTEQQIRQTLVEHKYPQSLIDAAFTLLQQGGRTGSGPGAKSFDLKKYVQQYEAQGYTPEQLRTVLLQQGYPQQDVDVALSPTVRHEVHLPTGTLVKLFLLLLVVALLGVGFMGIKEIIGGESPVSPSRLLDVTLTTSAGRAVPGDRITLTTSIINMGSTGRFDVQLEYQLVDTEGSVLLSREEAKAIATSITATTEFRLPRELEPGRYRFRAIATYSGERAVASEDITVEAPYVEEPTVEPSEPAPPTRPPVVIIGSDPPKDPVKDATAYAKRGDSAGAEAVCKQIANQAKRDNCLGTITLVDRVAEHCLSITGAEERDTCIMPFVLNGQYEHCEKLTSQERKDLCSNLQHLSSLEERTPPRLDVNDFAQPS